MKNRTFILQKLYGIALIALLLGTLYAKAAIYNWTNTAGGNWSDVINWSPNGVPGSSDMAVLPGLGNNYAVTLDVDASVSGLVVGAMSGASTQTFNTGEQTLTVDGVIQVNPQGAFNLDGGELTGTNVLVGPLSMSGVATLTGTVTVSNNSVLSIATGGSFVYFSALTLTNNGTVNWTDTQIYSSYGTQIYNYGLWDEQSDDVFSGAGIGGPDTIFDNFGTFRKSGNTGITTLDFATVFNNTGLVNVQQGTLLLENGAGTNSGSGTFDTATGATLDFSAGYTFANGAPLTGGGNVVLANDAAINGVITANLQLTGGTLSGTNVLVGTLSMSEGTGLTGVMTVSDNSVLNIATGGSFVYFNGLMLTNNGTVNWTNTLIYSSYGTQIYNYGLWDEQSDDVFSGDFLGGLVDTIFDNFGTFRKSGNTGTTTLDSSTIFTNTGTLDVQHGTLQLQGTYAILQPSGILSVGLNSATDFGSITFDNGAILNLAQAGTFRVTLTGGYVPAVNTTFQVLSANSSGIFSGAFTNFSSPDGAIWQTNYTDTSLVLTNVGQIAWATPANITYGTAVNASQLNASTTPSVAGTFAYNPVMGTVLNSGAGQLLTATFTPFNPSYAPASFQVPITVLQAPLSVIATNQTKTYGQTFSFAGTEFVASGLVNGDTVTSASLASAGAISNAPVSGSPYAITINSALGDAGLTNYIITYTNGTLTVNAAPLGITANSTGKTYGSNVIFAGTEFVSTPLQNCETIGTVTLTSAGAISNAPVSGSPYSIVPSAATGGTFSPGNYAITYTNGTLTVNRADLTVTANPASRDYGAANPAFSATYSGFVNGETISVVSGAPGFSTPATVTSGLGNYMITPSFGSLTAADYTFGPFVNGTLAITTAPVTITSGITANNKVYDRITTATLSSNSVVLLGIANGDAVSLNTNGYVANFVSGGVGSSIAVTLSGLTLSGARATNYSLTQPASLTASITAATVTINSGITANNKVYDRTTAATLSSNNVVLMGVVTGDSVTINTNGYVANFANGSVGNNIAVTVGGLTLSGASAANYALTQPASLTANITAATVTIASGITANNKVYNGTTTATINSNTVVLLGVITGDAVSLNTNGYIANFASAGVGSGIAVTVSGLTLSGPSAANYALTQPSALTANITAPGVQIFGDFPNIVISWPTNATIFVLNQTASLTPPVTWSPVTNGITVNGTDNTVTINTSTSEDQYFELIGAP